MGVGVQLWSQAWLARYEREARRAFREGRVVEEHPHPLQESELILRVVAHRLFSSELLPPRPFRKGWPSAP